MVLFSYKRRESEIIMKKQSTVNEPQRLGEEPDKILAGGAAALSPQSILA
jgi:hypothetical protein